MRGRALVLGGAAVAVCIAVAVGILAWTRAGSSGSLGSITATLVGPSASQTQGVPGGGFTVGVPASLTRESPPTGDSMAFLAERKGVGTSLGTSLFVRRATGAQSDLLDDVGLYNAEENFAHPQRTVERQVKVHIDGATTAVEIVSDYPDPAAGGALVRKLDVLVRTKLGGSYHVVLIGPPTAVTDAVIASEVQALTVKPPVTHTTPVSNGPGWSPPPAVVSVDLAVANVYEKTGNGDSYTIESFLYRLGYTSTNSDFNSYTLKKRPTTGIYVGPSGNVAEATAVAKALGLPATDVVSGPVPSGLNKDAMGGDNKVVVVEGDDLHARVTSGAVSASP